MEQESLTFSSYSEWKTHNYHSTYGKLTGDVKLRLNDASSYHFSGTVLEGFANTTFKVGNNRAFEIISNELCDKVQDEEKKLIGILNRLKRQEQKY